MSLTPPKNLSAVSLSSVNSFRPFGYFRPVSMTPGKNVIAGVNDTGDKLFTGVNDTADYDRGLSFLQN